MLFRVFDAETNILNRGEGAVGKMGASPFWPDNHIVCYGESRGENVSVGFLGDGPLEKPAPDALMRAGQGTDVLIVGHNIAFDLMYINKEWPSLFQRALPHLYIWDTQQVEYLLSGQTHLYPSLDEAATARGLPLKPDKVKEYWEQGIDTALIPRDLLTEYQEHDIITTRAVFLDQHRKVSEDPALMALVKHKMDDILMTTLMTIHGMKFDVTLAHQTLQRLDAEIEQLAQELTETAKPFFDPDFEWNVGTNDHVSLALYGGEYTIERDLPKLDENGEPQRYKGGQKAGQVKTKKGDVKYETNGLNLPPYNSPRTKSGNFSTAEEYLVKNGEHPFVKKLLRWREATKDADTYYRGYSALVFPDGCLHPQRNHCSTATGRLSCTAPNLENVSKSEE
jgi:DNA polymerase I-like protein with 3'-5' exonuclease and polymerase domains